MSMGEPEEALVRQARRGDKEAFGSLVRCYYRPVVAVTYRITGDAAAAEDVAQTAFLRAWEQLASLRDDAAFKAWLYRLAVRAAIDQVRRRPPDLPLLDDTVAAGGSTEGEALARERAGEVRRAVLALPKQCRAALVLREFEGLSYKEIAEALGIPMGTVMSRLAYARSSLRAMLGPRETR